jgi:RimJ/RimL family protein N-acetyltransferase
VSEPGRANNRVPAAGPDATRTTIPELVTERLILRGFRDADREPFAALNGDPEVMRYFVRTLDRSASDERVDRILDGWQSDGYGLWAVERRADGAFLGFTGLANHDYLDLPEIGWRFARVAWGNGYATEAARAALAWGFRVLAAPEIVSVTAVGNERSRAVMERLGMHRDPADDFPHPHIPDGHPLRAHVMYRLRREEWLEAAL